MQDLSQKLQRENVSLASTNSRLSAFIIDELLLSILCIAIFWNKFEKVTNAEELIVLLDYFVGQIILLRILYQSFFTWYYGASIGKIVLKIRVVNVDLLDTPSLLASCIRAIIRIVSEAVFYLGFLWGMLDINRQTWHDKFAKTMVINA